jgi:uncharacterized protein (TIGR03435 family)
MRLHSATASAHVTHKAGAIACGCLAAIVLLSAQESGGTLEVASVKRSDPKTDGFGITFAGDTVRTVGAPIAQVLVFAYDLDLYESPLGLPDWARRERFDITAKTRGDVTQEGRRAMMRALLAERFGLVAHTEQRQLDVLALLRTKPSAALPRIIASVTCPKTPAPGLRPCMSSETHGEFRTTGETMEGLAARIRGRLGKRVVDRTNLAGSYKFTVALPPLDLADSTSAAQWVTAVTDQLELKLVPDKASISVLVVDKLHQPTPD